MTVDELFDEWERAWSGRDPHGFDSLCAGGFQYEDPLTDEPLRGPGGVAAHARRLWAAFPDARVNSTGRRLHDGTYACAPCKVIGTQLGEIEGIGVTGRAIVVHALVYAELKDGLLWRVRAFYDLHAAGRSLGVFPRPGSASQRALLMLRGFGLRG